MHIATRLDIQWPGLPAPAFRSRWRCEGAPALRVLVGRARAVQQALATTTAAIPRLAIVVGQRSERVDCADLVVRVPDARAARVACSVLVDLASPRRDTIIDIDADDLARIVAAGRGGEGLLLRARAPRLVDAARAIAARMGGAVAHAMVVRVTASGRPETLDDLNAAMAILGDVDDQIAELALGLRNPAPPRPSPTIELLAGLSAAAANDDHLIDTIH